MTPDQTKTFDRLSFLNITAARTFRSSRAILFAVFADATLGVDETPANLALARGYLEHDLDATTGTPSSWPQPIEE